MKSTSNKNRKKIASVLKSTIQVERYYIHKNSANKHYGQLTSLESEELCTQEPLLKKSTNEIPTNR
jgi:hypothetical protein